MHSMNTIVAKFHVRICYTDYTVYEINFSKINRVNFRKMFL